MYEEIEKQAKASVTEIIKISKIKKGDILVVGCSTSEVCGSKIGSDSNLEVAKKIFKGIYSVTKRKGIFLAAQCCEHLNRSIIIEKDVAIKDKIVNVVPQPKAGGSFATCAYESFSSPVAVEEIKADAGLDIGCTMIGMHLRKVAVPVRLENNKIGEALVLGARVRPKFVGGIRAKYDESLL